MSRSLKKPLFTSSALVKKVEVANKLKEFKTFRTWSRDSVIIPDMIGHTFLIHNGKLFISRQVTQSMVGCKFGEFSFTRKPFHFPLKKMNKRKNIFYRK